MTAEVTDAANHRYIYFCKWCAWSFETILEKSAEAAPTATCPVCGADDAYLLGEADVSTQPGGHFAPGTGCCGTPGSA